MSSKRFLETKSQETWKKHRIEMNQDYKLMERLRLIRLKKLVQYLIAVCGILFLVSVLGGIGVQIGAQSLVEISKWITFGISVILAIGLAIWSFKMNLIEEERQVREHGILYAWLMPNVRAMFFGTLLLILLGLDYLVYLNAANFPLLMVFFGLSFIGASWYLTSRVLPALKRVS